MKTAFQELCKRASEERKAVATRRRAEKERQWQGAAKRFKGLSEALRLQLECRNIYALEDGYLVRFTRAGEIFTRRFRGSGDDTLSAAVKFRDEALKILGPEKSHFIPARVLKALGLSVPVPGISRDEAAKAYIVSSTGAKRSGVPRKFSFEFVAEEDAYAGAIECVEAGLQSK